ncbi:hypothetical protein N9L38_03955 [Candidatus Poseidoniales archaeon]|nr:hypothetical protein [Candidatus Poseidoniales archaeon]
MTKTPVRQLMLWGDVEEAIKAERLLRIQRIERLSTICALMCLSLEPYGWLGLH